MDILVNFSELVRKDRKDIASWKAACDAVREMSRIYPQCFSRHSDSFAPLRVHANAGEIEGIRQDRLEVFIAKFLMVLNNEVRIDSVDYSGEKRFIEAGRHAAWSMNLAVKDPEWKPSNELSELKWFNTEVGNLLTQDDYRLLFKGGELNHSHSDFFNPVALGKDLSIEFTVGGDRFSPSDVAFALANMSTEDIKTVECIAREECARFVRANHMTQDFLDKEVRVWITDNDFSKYLGRIFEQYSDKRLDTSQKMKHEKAQKFYADMCHSIERSEVRKIKR